jgi:Cdc6-like AAA superfamily ATPase
MRPPRVVKVNAMVAVPSRVLYDAACALDPTCCPEEGVPVSVDDGAKTLERACCQVLRKGTPVVIVVDEVDALLRGSSRTGVVSGGSGLAAARKGSALYALLETPHRCVVGSKHRGGAGVLVVGIANAVSLVDRALPALPVELRPLRVPFLPYSGEQLETVLLRRMARAVRLARLAGLALKMCRRRETCPGLPEALDELADRVEGRGTARSSGGGDDQAVVGSIIQPSAVTLCARKVATTSGDLRQALSAMRRALLGAYRRLGGTPEMLTEQAEVAMEVEMWQARRKERSRPMAAGTIIKTKKENTAASKVDDLAKTPDGAPRAVKKRPREHETESPGKRSCAAPLVTVRDVVASANKARDGQGTPLDVQSLPTHAQALLVTALRATDAAKRPHVGVETLRKAFHRLVHDRLMTAVPSEDFFPLLERLQGVGLVSTRGPRGRQTVQVVCSREDALEALEGTPLAECLLSTG